MWLKKLDNLFFIVGRSLLGLYFIAPGLSKVFDYASTLSLMKMKGVPFSAALLPMTIAIQLLGGIFLVLGKNLRLTALILFIIALRITYYSIILISGSRRGPLSKLQSPVPLPAESLPEKLCRSRRSN